MTSHPAREGPDRVLVPVHSAQLTEALHPLGERVPVHFVDGDPLGGASAVTLLQVLQLGVTSGRRQPGQSGGDPPGVAEEQLQRGGVPGGGLEHLPRGKR